MLAVECGFVGSIRASQQEMEQGGRTLVWQVILAHVWRSGHSLCRLVLGDYLQGQTLLQEQPPPAKKARRYARTVKPVG